MANASPVLSSPITRVAPDFYQAFNTMGRDLAANLWVARDARIVKFYGDNADGQVADVQINEALVVGYQTSSTNQTTPVIRQYPVFPKVPVMFPGGGGGALTFPVAADDPCLLVFLDRDFSDWWTSAQTGLPPRSARLHDPSDAICIVGLRPKPLALQNVSTTDVQLYGPNGPAEGLISVSDKIGIGNATGQLVTALDGLINNLIAAVTTGGQSFNAATITNLNASKAQIDGILK